MLGVCALAVCALAQPESPSAGDKAPPTAEPSKGGPPGDGPPAGAPMGPPPARVFVEPASLETIEQWREVVGEIVAVRRTEVAAQEEGLVVSIAFEVGDLIEAGDVLASFDDMRATAELERARSSVATRQARVQAARARWEWQDRNRLRVEERHRSAPMSELDLDETRTNAAVAQQELLEAESELVSAQAQLRLAQRTLDDHVVRAPFRGVVVRKLTEAGRWIARGGSVAEIVALEEVDAVLRVPESMLSRLRDADAAPRVRVPASTVEIAGTTVAIIPDGDPLSRLFPVRVRVANPGGALKPGMSVVGLVPSGQREPTLLVHKDAVLQDPAGLFLYFDAGGMAMVARVRPLFAVGDRLAVQAPQLRPGMNVIVRGNERLFPTAPITALPVQETGATPQADPTSTAKKPG